MIRDLIQWLDSLGTMEIVAGVAAGLLITAWFARRRPDSHSTHDQRVAERREHVRRIVNRDIEKRRKEGVKSGYPYADDPFRWN